MPAFAAGIVSALPLDGIVTAAIASTAATIVRMRA